jgi:hypothetical protein
MAGQRSTVFTAAGYAMVFLSLMAIVVAQEEANSAPDQWALSPDDDQSKANSWIIQPVKRPNIPIPPGGMLLMTMEPGSNMTMTDNLPPPPAQVTQPPTTTQESNEEEVESSSEDIANVAITSQSPAVTEPIVTSQNPIEESVPTTEYLNLIVSEPHYATGYIPELSSTETPVTTDNEIPQETQSPEEDISFTTQIFSQTTDTYLILSPDNFLITPAPFIDQGTSTPEADQQLTTVVTDTEVTDNSWLQNVVTDEVNGEISANTETDAAVSGVTTLVSTDVALSTELPEIVVVTEDFLLPVTTDASQTEVSESPDGSGSGVAVEETAAPAVPIAPVTNPEDLGIDIELSQDEDNQLARKKPASRHLLSSDNETEKKVEEVVESKEIEADAVHESGKVEEEARQYQRRRPYPIRPGDFGPRPPLNRQGYQQNLRPDYNSYDDYNVISRTYEYCYTIWCKFKTQLKNIGLL